MTNMHGKCGSKGFASGHAVVKDSIELEIEMFSVSNPIDEIIIFRKAQDICDKRLTGLIENSKNANWSEAADIFRSYQAIVRDEHFYKKIFDRVIKEKLNIEYILREEVEKTVTAFGSIESRYLRERTIDIENSCNELIHVILSLKRGSQEKTPTVYDVLYGVGNNLTDQMAETHDVILIASDLTPAETVRLDKTVVRGIVTERGGVTSHTVILAKSMGIPAVVGVKGAVKSVRGGDFVLVDGFSGEIVISPDEQAARRFSEAKNKYSESSRAFARSELQPAVTKDGFAINVTINSGEPGGDKTIDYERCDGIGLLRTEFIYLNALDYPDEETQFEIYKDLALRANGKSVAIRTLDIGGDKQAAYMKLPKEENPSLGYRSIRFCLDRKDIFAVQLRAALRASAYGNIKIMFPMICCVEELNDAKACVEAEKQTLKNDGIPFREDIPIGIMIETPAAVLLSDKLAKHADFFSIGTNDLIQFTTAADRSNELLSGICNCFNISVLRSVKIVSENAENAGIPWGICGEAASEEQLVPLWVAMGVKELSVAPPSVGSVKHIIRKLNRGRLLKDLSAVLDLESINEVKDYLASH